MGQRLRTGRAAAPDRSNLSPAPTEPPPAPVRRRGGARSLVLALLGIVAVVGAGATGYRYWLDTQLYISTDNAQITGRLVHLFSSPARHR